eukprot:NODE_247_length_11822_cov_1.182718.p6 type:complete len:227 gc:universal NODE_247_length_11822_cov_1.182718:6410-7090(+)
MILILFASIFADQFIINRFDETSFDKKLFKVGILGDSITESGNWQKGFVQLLTSNYVRHAEILGRGFSGWNTRVTVKYLKYILHSLPKLDLIFLFLGANDACITGVQTVPLEDYEKFTAILAEHLQLISKRVVLITPPPIDNSRQAPGRTYENTKEYQKKVVSIGQKLNLTVIDLYQVIKNEDLVDGLHFNDKGNEKVFNEIKNYIDSKYKLDVFLPQDPYHTMMK